MLKKSTIILSSQNKQNKVLLFANHKFSYIFNVFFFFVNLLLVQLLFAMSCCGLCQNYQIELLNNDTFEKIKIVNLNINLYFFFNSFIIFKIKLFINHLITHIQQKLKT